MDRWMDGEWLVPPIYKVVLFKKEVFPQETPLDLDASVLGYEPKPQKSAIIAPYWLVADTAEEAEANMIVKHIIVKIQVGRHQALAEYAVKVPCLVNCKRVADGAKLLRFKPKPVEEEVADPKKKAKAAPKKKATVAKKAS